MMATVRDLVGVSLAATAPSFSWGEGGAFELLGYDFMLDEEFRMWLIEVNSNPCLDLAGRVLESMVPQLIEDVFVVAVDGKRPPVERKVSARSWDLWTGGAPAREASMARWEGVHY